MEVQDKMQKQKLIYNKSYNSYKNKGYGLVKKYLIFIEQLVSARHLFKHQSNYIWQTQLQPQFTKRTEARIG